MFNPINPIVMRKLSKYVLILALLPAGLMLAGVTRDLINPIEAGGAIHRESDFVIHPVDDSDDWAETAASLGVEPDSLSVYEFMAHDGVSTYSEAEQQREEWLANR
jgi:hypothetical protein